MKKVTMMVRLTPKTREKLERLKDKCGLSFGVIIDYAIDGIDEYEDIQPIKPKDNGTE